ncbi:hypothetical protein HMPREF9946_03857 [Acetobacteraceae bacterium AT-5844]|nr:hypothetical protein HMPREF9946_03857 [Acetobacteraceae bacterium AT-5844]
MSTSEVQRLTRDLLSNPPLKVRLAPALAPWADPRVSASLLQAAGYKVAPEHLHLLAGGAPPAWQS